VQKIDEVKAATKLHALRKEPTKVERKVEAVEVPGPKKKTVVEKVVAPKKAKHEEPVKAKAEKMVELANPQEPKKAEVRKEPTKVERRVEVAKLPEPKKKAAVAVKAHDAAKSVTVPHSEKTADKKSRSPRGCTGHRQGPRAAAVGERRDCPIHEDGIRPEPRRASLRDQKAAVPGIRGPAVPPRGYTHSDRGLAKRVWAAAREGWCASIQRDCGGFRGGGGADVWGLMNLPLFEAPLRRNT